MSPLVKLLYDARPKGFRSSIVYYVASLGTDRRLDRGDGVFSFNNKEVKLGLKNVATISGLKVVSSSFIPNAIEETMFRERFFPGIK